MKTKEFTPVSWKALATAAALAAVAAVVSSASSFAAPPLDPRGKAIHDCNVEASKYGMSTWQSAQLDVYGECMAARGQPQ